MPIRSSKPNSLGAQVVPRAGARNEYLFNAQSLPVWHRDPLGAVTLTHYNSQGQVLCRTHSTGHSERFDYNTQGHLVAYTDVLV